MDVLNDEEATTELVRTKTSLLFDQTVVEETIGLLEGTTVYSTNTAPKNLVTKTDDFNAKLAKLKDDLKNRIKYDFKGGSIQVTGILTAPEIAEAKGLFNSKWPDAIDEVDKQKTLFYNDVLYAIFPAPAAGPDAAKEMLLQGDVNPTNGQVNPANSPATATAPAKRAYFMRTFLPFLRDRLTRRLLVDTLSGATGLNKEVTEVLITEVLTDDSSSRPLIEVFKDTKKTPSPVGTGWEGYLFPLTDDSYTFAVTSNTPPALKLDEQDLVFQQPDSNTTWLSDPVKLKAGKIYSFKVSGLNADLNELTWKTSTSPKAAIPASVLLPSYYSTKSVEDSFIKLQKSALLVNGFTLNADEVSYLQKHGNDFDGPNLDTLNFNKVSLNAWKHLEAYARLRNSLPKTDTNLIEFFTWTTGVTNGVTLSEKIATLTPWKKENIDKLIESDHFDLNHKENFRNEKNLVKLQQALYVADKINMGIDSLFEWAKPVSKFSVCLTISENIRRSIRARYKLEDWEQVVKPLNDQLRDNQKDALISYLLVQQSLINRGVTDADSLFEFFLIDVQMDACMQTSRIKQAISSVQLFVQRCFLGLEADYGVAVNVLDRGRWDWMSRNVIWQANRKVFLYPENWIEEGLRDDKSPFYKELESELLQKDINKQTVQDALKNYLYKVDEVANMQVIGLFVDEGNQKIHVFSRTRNTPFFFYYRHYKTVEKTWIPWEKIQIDIPSYDVEGGNNMIAGNGCYLIPAVLNNRLLIFFPQFTRKTTPSTQDSLDYWEIKMAWSEYRNGKWTQKQVSTDAACHGPEKSTRTLREINKYAFPVNISQFNIYICVFYDKNLINSSVAQENFGTFNTFHFKDGKFEIGGINLEIEIDAYPVNFNYDSNKVKGQIHSLQTGDITGSDGTGYETKNPFFSDDNSLVLYHDTNNVIDNFYFPYINDLLNIIGIENLNDFFTYNLTIQDNPSTTFTNERDEAFGKGPNENYNELRKPYSIYNWELFFHAPVTLADKLSKSQQFEEAMKWYHYVFNPNAVFDPNIDTDTSKRFWRFLPFKMTNPDNFLDSLFNALQPNQSDDKINGWRNKPFSPHLIARSRPSAYMKWVVMKYLDNLIAWGDYLFRQDTIESINYATQLYVIAGHILGPRPQMIPKRGKIKPETYNSLLDKWDAFGNATVELELLMPFSSQISEVIGSNNGVVVGLANVFGFASSLYFCIPNNLKLMGYWDTVADRLYKIRHCENFEGVFRMLPLWDPPIDPALLVAATAQGLSLESVLNDLNTPLPNYRFNYLIQKALELCNELKSLGSSLLSVFEKKDGEALAKMRAGHETTMHNLVMEVKKLQLEEANKALDGLKQNRKTPFYRLQHHLKLIGKDDEVANIIPADEKAEFTEISNQIEKPVDQGGGLMLISSEKEEMEKSALASTRQDDAASVQVFANIAHAIPNFNIKWPTDGTMLGGSNLGSALNAWSTSISDIARRYTFEAGRASKVTSFQRQLQDRVYQANLAGYEITQIDKQIISQGFRIQIANQEITNQQKQIDNANEIEEFLKNKYTNEELYSWMEGSIKTLYYQVYTLAYDLAKKAEKVFRFERGLTSSNYIQFGYWDASRDGLQSGERLYVGIKQLEAAYQEKRGYDFEVTKHISLRQVNPLALLELKENGKCEFELPEVLFDMDYPGHHMRRIKSVSLSVPCIAGPYTSINATLRLLENKFRINANDAKKYLEKTDDADGRFTTVNIPITSIAASTGQNDSGMFELNFKDERYMPFEGAGAVSKWSLEFPSDFRQFDYDTITDAIIHMRYTSIDGGDELKGAAVESLKGYIKSVEELSQREGLFAVFDLKHDFANEWYKAFQPPSGITGRIMQLGNLLNRLPAYTKTFKAKNIIAKDIYIAVSSTIKNNDLTLNNNNGSFPFNGIIPINETTNLFHLSDQEVTMDNWSLQFKDTIVEPDKIWLIVRYTLG